MTNPENIQKLRVKVAYLWGLGIGITVTALELAPKDSKSGDKYMISTIFGLFVLAVAAVMTWYVRRKEVTVGRVQNIDNLTEKK